MSRLSSMVARFLTQLILCVAFTTVVFFALSSYYFSDVYSGSLQSALADTLTSAEELLRRYEAGDATKEELNEAANPPLFSNGTISMFLDENGQALAQTDSLPAFDREDYLEVMLNRLERESVASMNVWSGDSSYLLMGKRTENNFVLVGVTMYAYNGAANTFRQRLLISMAGISVLVVLLSTLAARRVSRPARLITQTAARMREGEQVDLPENLPGRDAREIAAALNEMSRTIARTMGDLKYEKETMALILEGLQEGILAIDGDGSILHENTAAWELLGSEETESYRAVMAALKENVPEEQWIRRFSNGAGVLRCAVSRLPREEGKESRGTVALIRDVTEEEYLERTRRDYVANISHELRTPLSSIRGLAEGLRDGLVTEEKDRERCYRIIAEESTRLSRMVNDLLELSSLQANPTAFETEKVNPRELAEDLYDRDRRLFEKAGLQFSVVLPEEELPCLLSNEDRLTQVLTVFLDNARKYTPAGGRVALGAEKAAAGVRFFVRDNGIGMDEETCRLAFERFHQAERSHSDKGSGLGLSIAREILNKMGVSIQLQSVPGKGSEFSFVIPAQA